MDNNNFVFYASWGDIMDQMPGEKERAEFLAAVVAYGLRGQRVEVSSPLVAGAMLFACRDIDTQREKYDAYIEKQRENGAKGGRPKKAKPLEENPKNPPLFLETQKTQKSHNKNININITSTKEEREKEESAPAPARIFQSRELKRFYGDFGKVWLTEREYNNLVQKYGGDVVPVLIAYLDTYKETTGKEYENDYPVLLNGWPAERYKENASKKGTDARAVEVSRKEAQEAEAIREERGAAIKRFEENEAKRTDPRLVAEAIAAGVPVSEYLKRQGIC